jgi:hypothetical protein
MLIISTFFGIIIRMYFGDHNPPHFHVEFQGEKATFTFDGRLRSGNISSGTARKLVRDWARRHRLELMINWKNIEEGRPLNRIKPLEWFMNYLPQVIAARHIREFIVSTRFDDGTEKYIDISQWFKGPVFEPLRDPKFFKKFFIEAGTLAWPNGVDIAPEALYAARESSKKGHNKRMERTRKTRRSS